MVAMDNRVCLLNVWTETYSVSVSWMFERKCILCLCLCLCVCACTYACVHVSLPASLSRNHCVAYLTETVILFFSLRKTRCSESSTSPIRGLPKRVRRWVLLCLSSNICFSFSLAFSHPLKISLHKNMDICKLVNRLFPRTWISIKGWYCANISNICYSPLGRLVDWSIQHTSRWTSPLLMSLKPRNMQIFNRLVTANHTHTWWHNITPLS